MLKPYEPQKQQYDVHKMSPRANVPFHRSDGIYYTDGALLLKLEHLPQIKVRKNDGSMQEMVMGWYDSAKIRQRKPARIAGRYKDWVVIVDDDGNFGCFSKKPLPVLGQYNLHLSFMERKYLGVDAPIASFWLDGDLVGAYAGLQISDKNTKAIKQELERGVE